MSSPGDLFILPRQIPVITYPYEWSFTMWQDAALLTLHIAKESIESGMILKDATPFNVQFVNGKPLFIDTLSFEKYAEQTPWIAYRQFCECFLAPLLLQQYCHVETGKMFMLYPGGIPLDLLISLLPKKAGWNINTYLHIYLQATIKDRKGKSKAEHSNSFSKQKMLILLNGLSGYVSKLKAKKSKTTWDDYYASNILSHQYLSEKTRLVKGFLTGFQFTTMIDLGANNGHFSLLYKNTSKEIIAMDSDANCIDALYQQVRKENITNILPILNTLHNPSPAIGWNNEERASTHDRIKAEVVLALALVHHLAIGENIPLAFIARWLAALGKYIVVEFVPKADEKVQLLLQHREDIFHDYTLQGFKEAFSKKFTPIRQETIMGTGRVLFLMQRI